MVSTSTLFSPLLSLDEQLLADEIEKLSKAQDAKESKPAKACKATKGPAKPAVPKSDDAKLLERARNAAKKRLALLRKLPGDAAKETAVDDGGSCDIETALEEIMGDDDEADTPDHDVGDVADAGDGAPLSPDDAGAAAAAGASAVEGLEAAPSRVVLPPAWRVLFENGCRLMNDRSAAIAAPPPEQYTNLSLVMICADSIIEIGFLYWARQIHKLGTANRVKNCPRTRQAVYTVCNSLGTPELPLRDMVASGVATIIHPDVGIQMHKPRDMRDKVPDDFFGI